MTTYGRPYTIESILEPTFAWIKFNILTFVLFQGNCLNFSQNVIDSFPTSIAHFKSGEICFKAYAPLNNRQKNKHD